MEAWQPASISLVIVCAIVASCYVAYEKGVLDPIIKRIRYVLLGK